MYKTSSVTAVLFTRARSHFTCLKSYSTSVLYQLIVSPPWSSTNVFASMAWLGDAFSASQTRKRLSRNSDKGIAYVPGPMPTVCSLSALIPSAPLCVALLSCVAPLSCLASWWEDDLSTQCHLVRLARKAFEPFLWVFYRDIFVPLCNGERLISWIKQSRKQIILFDEVLKLYIQKNAYMQCCA